jgi:hypothetical protein
MGPVLTIVSAGSLWVALLLAAISERSFSLSSVVTLVLPVIVLVEVGLTYHRVSGAAR